MPLSFCLYCHAEFKNDKKLNLHLALEHEATPDGTPIGEASIKSLETTKQRVHYLLKKIPATRNSDWLLYLYLLRYWGQAMVYNQETKKIQFNDPEGISYEQFIHLPSWETCRRSRQSIVAKYPELAPTDKVVAYRRSKEKAYNEYFKEEKLEGYVPDTFIPFK